MVSYTIKAGDSLSKIAVKYGRPASDWKKIMSINPQIKNANLIYPGRTINIPTDWNIPITSPAYNPAPVSMPKPEESNMTTYLLIGGVIGLAWYANKKKWF